MSLTKEEILGHPIIQALNPEGKAFLKAVWLPKALNPGTEYDVQIAALIAFQELPHIKVVPAFQMMFEDFCAGKYEGKYTIVVPSSGNTAHAVALLAPAFGFQEVKVVLSVDVPESKKGILAALSSVELIEVPKGKSTSKRAEEEARKPGHYLLDQYNHEGNVRAHELFTGPEILRACGGDIDGTFISMGSTGTLTGVFKALKKDRSDRQVIGVRPVLGDRVPGNRDQVEIDKVVRLIPWQKCHDGVIEVTRKDAFIAMRSSWPWLNPQIAPSGGLCLAAYHQWWNSLDETARELLRGKRFGFICADDGRFYSERTTGELDPDQGLS